MSSLSSRFNTTCDGWGSLFCYCGGDLCICGLDGEPCPGCEECRDWEDDLDEQDLEDWQNLAAQQMLD